MFWNLASEEGLHFFGRPCAEHGDIPIKDDDKGYPWHQIREEEVDRIVEVVERSTEHEHHPKEGNCDQ